MCCFLSLEAASPCFLWFQACNLKYGLIDLSLTLGYPRIQDLSEGDSFCYFHKDRMLVGGDFNLNSRPHYTDSLKEILKHQMLHHEAIFRNQVCELHRLYRIQKTLMEDLSWKEFEKYTSWALNTKSIPFPFQDPQRKRTLAGERIFSGPSMVGSTSTANWNVLEDCQGSYSKLQQKPLNLQLPANEYISSGGTEFPENGNLGPSFQESIGTKEFLHANCGPDREEVKLSISIGGGTTEKGCSSRSWYNKETCFSTLYVIDSEESVERESNEEVKPLSSFTSEAPTTFVGDKHGIRGPYLSDSRFSGGLKKDIGHRPFMNNYSLANPNGSNQENKSCCADTGDNECQLTGRFVSLLTSKQQSSLCETTHADLNGVKHDESSFSSDPLPSFPSLTEHSPAVVHGLANESDKGTRSVTTSGRKTDDSLSDEASIVLQQDSSAYCILMDSKGEVSGAQVCNVRTKCRENSKNKVRVIDLERTPEDLVDHCEVFSNQDIMLGKEDVDFSVGLPNGFSCKDYQAGTSDVTPTSKVASNEICTSLRCTDSPHAVDDAEVRQINFERSEEDTVSSGPERSHVDVEAEHCKSSDATSKTNCWTGHNSCRMKDLHLGTVRKGELENSKISALEESGATLLGSELTEVRSAEQDPFMETGVYSCACTEGKSSDETKTEHQCRIQLQNVEKEMDILVQKAAESLICISLDNSFCPQDFFGEAGSNALENMIDQPQYSSDSFEWNTLRLTECSADVYSVSSMPVEVNETDKGCGWKLKRGSRLKDFQKDILPGLVSLSRHEICEDINIIGAALRSKEYRKNRCRSIGGENWSVPVKGRRSKLNYIGRRNYY